MPNKQAQLEKLKKLYDVAREDTASRKEVVALVSALTDEWKKLEKRLNEALNGNIVDIGNKTDKVLEQEKKERESLKLSVDKLGTALEKEIERVQARIPIVPSLEPLYEAIEKVRSEIPDIPEMPEMPEIPEVTAEEVRDKLETLKDDNRLDKSAIKGLEERLTELEGLAKKSGGRVGMKKITSVRSENLTSQCDGVKKTFTLPSGTLKVLGVWGTQFPVTFDAGVDWTFAGRTLTLTDAVGAPEAGQTLFALIETQFYA